MADYFTEFNVAIKLEKEARDWAIQLNGYLNELYHGKASTLPCPSNVVDAASALMLKHGDDYCPHCIVSEMHLQEGILIQSNGEADQDVTASYIQTIFKQFNLDKCVRMYIAYTCTKPDPDGFGGTACVITRKDIEWLNVDDWVVNTEAALLEKLEKEAGRILTQNVCNCKVSEILLTPEDDSCTCGKYNHHVHCACGGIIKKTRKEEVKSIQQPSKIESKT